MNFLSVKRKIRELFPDLWENSKAFFYNVKLRIPFFYPQAYRDLVRLSGDTRDFWEDGRGKGKKILFFAVRQDPLHIMWQLVMARALKMRGQKVDYIACDGLIRKCCNERWYPEIKKLVCKGCHFFAKKLYSLAGLDVKWVSSYALREDISGAQKAVKGLDFAGYRGFMYKGLPLGELVRPSVFHFTRVEDIESFGERDRITRRIYRDFISGSVMMFNVCQKILSECSPDVVVMLNGKFASERVMFELCKRNDIRTVVMETGIQPDTIVMLHDSFIDYRKVEGWERRKQVSLTDKENERLDREFSLRKTGGRSEEGGLTADYWTDVIDDKNKIIEELGLKGYRKVATLFPNIAWDSAISGLTIMFRTMKEWVSATIAYFEKHPDICLIIRAHPADATWPVSMRDSIYTWIKNSYGKSLPENIKLISPYNQISSYVLMDITDIGIVSSSTTGLEMALMGKPVVVVGRVHYWGKGFTLDPVTEEEYHKTLDELLLSGGCDRERGINVELARRYAYFIFFEASLRFKYVNTKGYTTIPRLEFSSYQDLIPGKDPILDAICDGIVDGRPFVVDPRSR